MQYFAVQEKGAARCCGHPGVGYTNWFLEGKYRPDLGAQSERRAAGQAGDLRGANIVLVRNSVAGVVALFQSELDPGVHLVEDGHGVEVALDRTGAGRTNSLGESEVIAIGRIYAVFIVRLPARIPPLRVGIEPARERESDLHESAVTAHCQLWSGNGSAGTVGSKDHRGRAIHREGVRLIAQTPRVVVVGQELAAEEESQVSSHVSASHNSCPAGWERDCYLIAVAIAVGVVAPGEGSFEGICASRASRAKRYG